MLKLISPRAQDDSTSWKKKLMELEEKVRNTQRLIQEEKASIANSKQEAQEMTEQIQVEFAEISTLSRKIVSGDDKADEEIIARADAVRAETIHVIERFLNQLNYSEHLMLPVKT